MEIDENLLSKLSSFLSSSEGSEVVSGLKNALNLDDDKGDSDFNLGSLSTALSGTPSILDGVNINKLIPLVTAISSAKTDDRAINLLNALKPLLSEERRGKIDKAVSIMKILALLPILKEHGFSISDLLN